jgi:hydroxymethylbilane synthase
MLPAPSQGAVVVVCRQQDTSTPQACALLNDAPTALCTKIEKDFLRVLMGGCTTPISALAILKKDTVFFRGNILSLDGKEKIEVERTMGVADSENMGSQCAQQLLQKGADKIIATIRNAGA